MNLSRKWLNEFVDGVSVSDINDHEFSEAMTLSGSKVETFEDLGKEISNVVVGKVLSMAKHPNSDHMWLCMVDAGQAEPVQIVTGAWNVHVGDLVPVALDNSTLPGGKTITKGKLRGEVSDGMLCGLYELGLDERDAERGRHIHRGRCLQELQRPPRAGMPGQRDVLRQVHDRRLQESGAAGDRRRVQQAGQLRGQLYGSIQNRSPNAL